MIRSKDPLTGRLVCGRKLPLVYAYGIFPYIFTVRVNRPLLAAVLVRTTIAPKG